MTVSMNLGKTQTRTVSEPVAVEIFLRKNPTGSVDVVAKGAGRQARIIRILGTRNRAAKVGCLTFGRKSAALRAMGFQTAGRGRVAFAR